MALRLMGTVRCRLLCSGGAIFIGWIISGCRITPDIKCCSRPRSDNSALLTKYSNAMGLTVGYVKRTVCKQHTVRARESARQGIGFGAVPAHARPQHGRDNTGLQIHAPNHMILRIGYVKDIARSKSQSLEPGKFC